MSKRTKPIRRIVSNCFTIKFRKTSPEQELKAKEVEEILKAYYEEEKSH
jgi:hypothetical protein